jgi:hypothetical protein
MKFVLNELFIFLNIYYITITEGTSKDYKTIQEIAHKTWPETYGAICQKSNWILCWTFLFRR